MSGGYIPYRLRQNKSVERLAFVELLSRVNRHPNCQVRDYTYVGLGGTTLEDFRVLHSVFAIEQMISLENNPEVHRRQQFNKPHSCVDCKLQDVGEFVDTFVRESPTIAWLDYAEAAALPDQVAEFGVLLEGLEPYDIAKITLNAHAATWGRQALDEDAGDLHKRRYELLEQRLGQAFPSTMAEYEQMTENRFPEFVLHVVAKAANSAMEQKGDQAFLPLTAFSYADGQRMVTATGIVLDVGTETDFLDVTGLDDWPLRTADFTSPTTIHIPDLTMRERLFVDSLLPSADADTIRRTLGFDIEEHARTSREALRSYADFYRHVPFFSEIVT